jgi:bacterioferritin-associated ferredoxin
MYVCVCNGVTDNDIRREVDAGCTSVSELTMRTGAGASCGSCIQLADTLIGNMLAAKHELPVIRNRHVGPLPYNHQRTIG